MSSDLPTVPSHDYTPSQFQSTNVIDQFFSDRCTFLRTHLSREISLTPFRQLPDALLMLLYAEKINLRLIAETRLVKDENGIIISGYAQDYHCQHDQYHPKELMPFNLKGYWIPENEGELFITDVETPCPLIRQGPQGKEVLFLIHPKTEHLFGPLMEKYKQEKLLIPALSLSSFRTLLISLPTSDQNYFYTMVKLSLDEKIAGTLRILSLKECACSVGMTAILKHSHSDISFFRDDVAFVPHARLLMQEYGSKEVGMIHRQIPERLLNSNEYILPFFSLFGKQNQPLLDL
jgi:hypothetical protein